MSASNDILTLGQMSRHVALDRGQAARHASRTGLELVPSGTRSNLANAYRPRAASGASGARRSYAVHAAVTGGSARSGYQTHPSLHGSARPFGGTAHEAAGDGARFSRGDFSRGDVGSRSARASRFSRPTASEASRGAHAGTGFATRVSARAQGEDAPRADARARRAARGREVAETAQRSEGAPKGSPVQAVLGWAVAHRIVAVVACVLVFVVLMLYPSVQSLYIAKRAHATLSSQLSDVNATNGVLQSQVDALMTKEGIEDEARRRGYVAEGDTAVDMEGVTDSTDPSSDTSAISESEGTAADPWYISALDAIFHYDAAKQGLS